MEILQFLLSFLLKEYGDKIGDFFSKGFSLETFMPLLESLFSFKNQERPPKEDRRSFGLEPVSLIANKDIVYALNLYFSKH